MAVGMASPALADADANGYASDSPGILSGNVIQAPIHVPVNVCGNTINVIGFLNPAIGNDCVNNGSGPDGGHEGPPFGHKPPYYDGEHDHRPWDKDKCEPCKPDHPDPCEEDGI
ncbi:chaplin [Streptomyces sp. PSKA28]|uniref:Chaplin n=1 Tax=Streptomyces himalayensis subsp. himalayensis TaxID=2756131 RepID=A0A7W0DHM0_9ACTN|nr:chaplin [Streptomyces himalayensis subsp. himalayensis]